MLILRKATSIVPLILLMVGLVTNASEFRSISPISAPGPLPEGAIPLTTFQPVDPEALEESFKEMCSQYTSPTLTDYLSDNPFYDKQRLLDTIRELVPRDAELVLLSPLRGVQTLQQYKMPNPNGNGHVLVSTVSVIAQTRLRFNDPQLGLRNLDGINEFILRTEENFE